MKNLVSFVLAGVSGLGLMGTAYLVGFNTAEDSSERSAKLDQLDIEMNLDIHAQGQFDEARADWTKGIKS